MTFIIVYILWPLPLLSKSTKVQVHPSPHFMSHKRNCRPRAVISALVSRCSSVQSSSCSETTRDQSTPGKRWRYSAVSLLLSQGWTPRCSLRWFEVGG